MWATFKQVAYAVMPLLNFIREHPNINQKTIFELFRIAFKSKTLGQKWAEFGVKKHVMLCDFKWDTTTYSYKQPFF